jgi:uncharacterized membrane protein
MATESVPARIRHSLRRNFLAGLLVILPLVITIWIIGWMIELLESGIRLLPPFVRPDKLLPFYVPGLNALVSLVMIVVLGFIVSSVVSQRISRYFSNLLLRIPVFRGVYAAVKRLVEAILLPAHPNFRRVVLVEYPRRGVYAIGLMTGVTEGEVQERTAARVLNVFVPTTPNPTSGYYVLVPEEDVIMLNMSVEEAFKLVMSGGIVTPERAAAEAERSKQLAGSTEIAPVSRIG